MTSITARVPLIDWSKGFSRHWNGENPAVMHAYNALSLLFPQAESFFIGVASEAKKSLDMTRHSGLKKAVEGFIGQESIHNLQHMEYNEILKRQGFENTVYEFVQSLQERTHRNYSLETKLAIVAAYEHYTAILGNYILSNPTVLQHAEPKMALVWGWHSAEETEHKAVCFDLYRAFGGKWYLRVLMFLLVTLNFSIMFGRLYLSLLLKDECLRRNRILKTSSQVFAHFFGRLGVGWYFLRDGIRYLSPWFHPWNQDNHLKLEDWLQENYLKLKLI